MATACMGNFFGTVSMDGWEPSSSCRPAEIHLPGAGTGLAGSSPSLRCGSALGCHFSWLKDRLSFLQGISELFSVLALAELSCMWMTEFLNSLLKTVSTESYKAAIKFSCPG